MTSLSDPISTLINEVARKVGTLPISSWSGIDTRKRLYLTKFAWVPLPLTDSEKPWAWWETVGMVNDYETGWKWRFYSQARIAQGVLSGEMVNLNNLDQDSAQVRRVISRL